MKDIVVLGSTGSIGTQTLETVRMHGFSVKGLSAYFNASLLERQAREFKPETVCVVSEKAYPDLKQRLSDTGIKVLCGEEGLCELASVKCGMTVNAIVGMAGLEPTLAAIEAGNDIGLANKETLVVGGALVKAAASAKKVSVLPIDSEHSAIFQSLMGNTDNKIEKILLTASGGPFYGYSAQQLRTVTKEQALRHPNWSMGRKITIDSATLMNKGLELIEAVWLFSMDPKDIDIVVHRQSVIHSLVEFCDNSVIAQLGVPDMRIPIQYALTYPNRIPSPVKELSLTDYGTLTFDKPDYETFGLINVCRKAINDGGLFPACANAANEEANLAFRQGKIKFLQIEELVRETVENAQRFDTYKLGDVLDMYNWARGYVKEKIMG